MKQETIKIPEWRIGTLIWWNNLFSLITLYFCFMDFIHFLHLLLVWLIGACKYLSIVKCTNSCNSKAKWGAETLKHVFTTQKNVFCSFEQSSSFVSAFNVKDIKKKSKCTKQVTCPVFCTFLKKIPSFDHCLVFLLLFSWLGTLPKYLSSNQVVSTQSLICLGKESGLWPVC